jgi:aryl-alcohol dehydrogenase-like predicted oxidoreductase
MVAPMRPSSTIRFQPVRNLEVRSLGKSGLKVSALGLGTMTFGASTTYMKGVTAEESEARLIFDHALDRGLTLIDTANSYSQGTTERLLGEWLKGKRDNIVLASKCGLPVLADSQPGPYRDRGLSRSHIIESCEASLRRLKTDHLDLYQMHMQDGTVPIEETLRACDDLIRSGKVRYIGCSNYTGYRLTEAAMVAQQAGHTAYASVQTQWSLAVRDAEREVVPAAVHQDMGIIIWSPLARGFLSGKFRRGEAAPEGSRLAEWAASYARMDNDRNWNMMAVVSSIAEKRETSCAAVAIRWLTSQSPVSSVLIGARSIKQFDDSFDASQIELSQEEVDALEAASRPDWGYPYDFIGERQPW